MRLPLALLTLLALPMGSAAAQHTHGPPPPGEPQEADPPAEAAVPPGEAQALPVPGPAADAHTPMRAAMTMPLGLPLTQLGSGTSWQPPVTPMFGHMALLGDWAFMLHYNAFSGPDVQGTPRGATEWPTLGWVMGMARAPVLGGQLTARAMLSPEPLLLGRRGYPLLLQTGETAYGAPLVDRQHPHDLFMELALLYQHALGEALALELYVAPAGEPAVGPTAFPHRLSALTDPLAPLSHHWQDSTHITFGVLTAGLFTHWGKLEASLFNGREPDEARLGLDVRAPDSLALRFTAIPGPHWALQASWAFLREPEASAPGEDLRRYTASLHYTRPLGGEDLWTASAVWGENHASEEMMGRSHSFLVEGSAWLAENILFGRAEYAQKTEHDFALHTLPHGTPLPVGSVVLGYLRTFGSLAGLVPGVGVRGSINLVGGTLAGHYGTRFPMGGMVFVSLRPERMRGGMHHGP